MPELGWEKVTLPWHTERASGGTLPAVARQSCSGEMKVALRKFRTDFPDGGQSALRDE